MSRSKRGFTLTEIVAVLAIITVGIGLLHSVFVTNWSAYEDRIKRANLWSQAGRCFEQMSIDARNASRINIINTLGTKTVSLTNPAATNPVTTYEIKDTGILSRTHNNTVEVISTNTVFANSGFQQNGPNLAVTLELQDSVFNRNITITAETEVLLRN